MARTAARSITTCRAPGIYLRTRADVDPARIGAWGGSYGGYLVAMALARASDMYKVGVDFHGVHNWATELGVPVTEPDYKIAFESSPMNFLKTWRSPVLLIQGDDDPDVQFNQTVMLADALRRQGVEMEEMVIPDEVPRFSAVSKLAGGLRSERAIPPAPPDAVRAYGLGLRRS